MGVMFNEELSGVPEFDEASGLGVTWIRDEPPREETSHFVLLLRDQQLPFSGYYKQAIGLIMHEKPGLSAREAAHLGRDDNRVMFEASNIGAKFDRPAFVRVWRQLISNAMPKKDVRVIYREGSSLDSREGAEWSCGQ